MRNAITYCSHTRVATSSTCQPTKLIPFGNMWVVKHLRCIAWAAPISRVQNHACSLRFRKSPKNLWSCISAASLQKVTHSRQTPLGNMKWKVPFLSRKLPTNAQQLLKLKATWSAPHPWTAWCVVMWVSAKPKWLFALPLRPYKMASR